jgi:hypothetical protein
VDISYRSVPVAHLSGLFEEKRESANAISGDFGGDRFVLLDVTEIVACDATLRFLNAGVQKPVADRTVELILNEQTALSMKPQLVRSVISRFEKLQISANHL